MPFAEGGPRKGSGAKALPPELRRRRPLRVMVRDGQDADIRAIADAWNVPPATAVYAMVEEYLARCRSVPMELGRDEAVVREACRIMLSRLTGADEGAQARGRDAASDA